MNNERLAGRVAELNLLLKEKMICDSNVVHYVECRKKKLGVI